MSERFEKATYQPDRHRLRARWPEAFLIAHLQAAGPCPNIGFRERGLLVAAGLDAVERSADDDGLRRRTLIAKIEKRAADADDELVPELHTEAELSRRASSDADATGCGSLRTHRTEVEGEIETAQRSIARGVASRDVKLQFPVKAAVAVRRLVGSLPVGAGSGSDGRSRWPLAGHSNRGAMFRAGRIVFLLCVELHRSEGRCSRRWRRRNLHAIRIASGCERLSPVRISSARALSWMQQHQCRGDEQLSSRRQQPDGQSWPLPLACNGIPSPARADHAGPVSMARATVSTPRARCSPGRANDYSGGSSEGLKLEAPIHSEWATDCRRGIMGEVVTDLPARGVFLSYSHRDGAIAARLKDGLERLGVGVRIDSEAMQPGTAIQRFIRDSIRTTVATVWVVSEASLLSDWVAVEIVTSLNDVELWEKRRLMACYLDEVFLDCGFRLRATDKIDARLKEIDANIAEYVEKKLDTVDLDSEKSRLFDLRNNLGKLLRYLKESLCVDVRAQELDASLQRLANNLRPLAPGNHAPLAAASDVERRVQEVYDLFDTADGGERGMKRLMDFVRDFSDGESLRKAKALNSSFRLLGGPPKDHLEEFFAARESILSRAFTLLDGVVDMLTQKVAS